MCRTYHMTYIPSQKRWTKMYKGTRFYVSCQQLDAPETKEASWRQANAWWQAKLATMAPTVRPGTQEALVRILEAWAGKKLSGDELPLALAGLAEELPGMDKDLRTLITAAVIGPEKLATQQAGATALLDAADNELTENTIDRHVQRWLDMLKVRVGNGRLSPASFTCYEREIRMFVDYVGKYTPVSAITEDKLEAYFLAINDSEISVPSKKTRFTVAKMFLRWLCIEKKVIPVLGNLSSRNLSFAKPDGKKETWSAEQFKEAYAKSTGVKRLALLLAANCGFYASDMANLSGIDWQAGTITMSRKKTHARECTWALWPETLELLKMHHTELAGTWKREMVDGKVKTTHKLTGLKQLRHTSISFIANSELAPWQDYFAGHSAKTMAAKHYAKIETDVARKIASLLHDKYFDQ